MRASGLVVCTAAWLLAGCNAASIRSEEHAVDGGDDATAHAKSPDCAACHTPEYRSARHHVGERPTTCAICHAQASWKPSRIDHAWPLDGAHDPKRCFACHTGDPPKFEGTPKECIGCHKPDYERAPGHAGKFPTTCQTCHTTTAWKPTLPHEWKPPPVAVPIPAPNPAPSASTAATVKPKPKSPPKPKPKPPLPPDTTAKPPDVGTGATPRGR